MLVTRLARPGPRYYPLMSKPRLLAVAAFSVLAAVSTTADAQSIIKNPGDHPDYKVEIEPHLDFGWANRGYASGAFGAGARFSIPIVQNGFISTINNSVAISFGLDYLRYNGCYYRGFNNNFDCSAGFINIPVAMQWNFWLTPRWSVFGEPGLYIYHGFFEDICGNDPRFKGACYAPSTTGVDFLFAAGGRFHFNDSVALTLRVGYPTLSFGVSFLL